MGGWVSTRKIMPLCGPILQADTCQRFSAELRFQDRAECGKSDVDVLKKSLRTANIDLETNKTELQGKNILTFCKKI
jgi:hypothetical protein